ncbi:MAG: hypothetical protein Q9162_003779, partial [Coniocarpon cinnabarinum]
MLKRWTQRPWICAQCLQNQQRQQLRRTRGHLRQSAAAPAQAVEQQHITSHVTPGTNADDDTLRRVFDSSDFWKQFSTNASRQVSGKRSGLLQNKYLTDPQGFQDYARDGLKKCQRIVDTILTAQTTEEYRRIVKHLDRLSDQLCRVIDLVEFVRNVHPNAQIQHAASFAHGRMYEYMNVLNTTPGLHTQLEQAMSMPEVTSQWSEEEKVTARILLKDFQQSAISGPEKNRERFIQLSNDIVEIGSELNETMEPEQVSVKLPSSRLKGMDPVAVKRHTSWGTTTLPTFGSDARLALATVEDPEVRRDVYMAMRTASRSTVGMVERLVEARAELAKLSGHESFAHMSLGDKMSKTPEAANSFLHAMAADNLNCTRSDLSELLELKRSDAHHHNFPNEINAWDRDYYANRLRSRIFSQNRPSDTLSSYFSLGTVMQGLSRLFSRLYGVRLVPREPVDGETWNHDVRRLDVIDERDGHVAVIYCDLFERPNKSPNPAHFTLRCSREISSSEINEATAAGMLPSNPSLEDLSHALNDGMALNVDPSTNTLKQLPTIGFICDFPRPLPNSKTPTLLSFRHFTTLFHEMGHCLHSILGRTSLQNVAGTRCATDFAELPSILMEHFAVDPSVLNLYARHWETDKLLDATLVGQELERQRRLRGNFETEAQIQLAALDQALHSRNVPPLDTASRDWSSTDVYHAVYNDPIFASIPEPRGTSWHGFFGHLYQYGAVYYSYLFDRAIAGKVWEDVFNAGAEGRAVEREAGERYKE